MEKLTDKRSVTFDYTSRYSGVPYYYDTVKNRDVPGIGHQIDFNTSYVLHTVKADDTLDKLALDYYDNPSYWWAIAYFNKINDPFISLSVSYTTLKIPTISSIVFED
jgi:nucleoid-associated protein YgaU